MKATRPFKLLEHLHSLWLEVPGESARQKDQRREMEQDALSVWLDQATHRIAAALGLSSDDYVIVLRELCRAAGLEPTEVELERQRLVFLSRGSTAFSGDSGSGSGSPIDPDSGGMESVVRYKEDRSE